MLISSIKEQKEYAGEKTEKSNNYLDLSHVIEILKRICESNKKCSCEYNIEIEHCYSLLGVMLERFPGQVQTNLVQLNRILWVGARRGCSLGLFIIRRGHSNT